MTRKRPHMSLSVKLDAAILQLGLDPSNVEYDHDLALGLREYNEETGKWNPDANDPRYITLRSAADHAVKTDGPPATAAGGDKNRIAKAKRIAGGGKKRRGPKLRSRPFSKFRLNYAGARKVLEE